MQRGGGKREKRAKDTPAPLPISGYRDVHYEKDFDIIYRYGTRIRPVLVKNMIILASYVNEWTRKVYIVRKVTSALTFLA